MKLTNRFSILSDVEENFGVLGIRLSVTGGGGEAAEGLASEGDPGKVKGRCGEH